MIDLLAGANDPDRPPGTVEKHANYLKLLSYIVKARMDSKSRSTSMDGISSPSALTPREKRRISAPIPVVSLEGQDDSSITIRLFNPLFVPIEISELFFSFVDPASAESEVSGLIRLEPGESKQLSLQVIQTVENCAHVKHVVWSLVTCGNAECFAAL
jgi:hypothetical protein